jgi:hypothetical protein
LSCSGTIWWPIHRSTSKWSISSTRMSASMDPSAMHSRWPTISCCMNKSWIVVHSHA